MEKKLYFTQRGIRILKEEIRKLEKELQALQAQTAYVAEVGGNQYHDNSSYEMLIVDIRGIDWRLKNAHHCLNQAIVVRSPTKADIVSIGTRVKIMRDEEIATWNIVGFGESSPENGSLAYNTPIASLFMRKHVGDSVTGFISNKRTEIEILEISIGVSNEETS